MLDALTVAVNDLRLRETRVSESARTIAVGQADLPEEYVKILENKKIFETDLAVVQTKSDMLGSLLDILA